jgi:hypothetical protein
MLASFQAWEVGDSLARNGMFLAPAWNVGLRGIEQTGIDKSGDWSFDGILVLPRRS